MAGMQSIAVSPARETGIFDQGQETPQATTNAIFMRLVDAMD